MTGNRTIVAAHTTRFYFAQPYTAWRRGPIEHRKGLIRRTYPKGTDFTTVTQLYCTRLARQLNQRPRRRLGFQAPEEGDAPYVSHFTLEISIERPIGA